MRWHIVEFARFGSVLPDDFGEDQHYTLFDPSTPKAQNKARTISGAGRFNAEA